MIADGCKAHFVERWEANSIDVWIYRGDANRRQILRPGGESGPLAGAWLWETDDSENSMPKPTLTLPVAVMEAIVEEARNKAVGPAVADAIADARAVRDRLLTLVERVTA